MTTYVATINYTTHAPPWGGLSNALSPVGANMYSDYFSESTTTPAATDIGSPATQILSRDFLQAKAQACGAQPRKMPCEEPRKKNCPAKIQSWTPKFLSAREEFESPTLEFLRGNCFFAGLFASALKKPRVEPFFFWLFAATQLAGKTHQERTQVVCSNKEAPGSKALPQWTLDQ